MSKIQVDTIIEAEWVLPGEPLGTVLTQHALAIQAGIITAIRPIAEVRERFSATQHLKLGTHVLIPGLINLHTHAAMTLLRGVADDRSLMQWLENSIWPMEAKHLSPAFVRDGTMIACAEMLRGGVTCFNDMYFFPESAVQAVLASKIRAAIGMVVFEFASAYASQADEYLAKGFALRDSYAHHPLLQFCMAPHGPYTISDNTFNKIAAQTAETNTAIHMHIHETQDEIKNSLDKYGVRPLARLQALNLLSPSFIGVHSVHLNDQEISLLAENGCHVAHCPTSNLKLGSGIAPIVQMRASGINVGIGTDGAASNNKLDMFSEMRLAALLANGQNGAAALPAHEALQMATLNAAKALSWDDKIGSLLVGKHADITAIDLSEIETTPCYDAAAQLVYAAGRENVTHVWVNGELLLEDRQLLTIDMADIKARADHWRGVIKPQ